MSTGTEATHEDSGRMYAKGEITVENSSRYICLQVLKQLEVTGRYVWQQVLRQLVKTQASCMPSAENNS